MKQENEEFAIPSADIVVVLNLFVLPTQLLYLLPTLISCPDNKIACSASLAEMTSDIFLFRVEYSNQAFLTKHAWLENRYINNIAQCMITGCNLYPGAYMCKRWAHV